MHSEKGRVSACIKAERGTQAVHRPLSLMRFFATSLLRQVVPAVRPNAGYGMYTGMLFLGSHSSTLVFAG